MAKQPQSVIEKTAHHGGRASGEEGRSGQTGSEESVFEASRYAPTIPAVIEEGFDSPEWVFQVVEGGIPVLIFREEGEAVIRSQRGRSLSRFFPELIPFLKSLPEQTAIDCDLVCRNAPATPHNRLFMDDAEIASSATKRPCLIIAHDLLSIGGRDFTTRTTGARRRALAVLLKDLSSPCMTLAGVVEQNGSAAALLACERGFSSVRGKMKASPYPGRESRIWVEIPCDGRRTMVVGGYREVEDRLILLAGIYENSELEFLEEVTVPRRLRNHLLDRMVPLTRALRSFREAPPWEPGTRWTSPDLVIELNDDELERIRPDLCPDNVRSAHAGVWRQGRGSRRIRKETVRVQRRLTFGARSSESAK